MWVQGSSWVQEHTLLPSGTFFSQRKGHVAHWAYTKAPTQKTIQRRCTLDWWKLIRPVFKEAYPRRTAGRVRNRLMRVPGEKCRRPPKAVCSSWPAHFLGVWWVQLQPCAPAWAKMQRHQWNITGNPRRVSFWDPLYTQLKHMPTVYLKHSVIQRFDNLHERNRLSIMAYLQLQRKYGPVAMMFDNGFDSKFMDTSFGQDVLHTEGSTSEQCCIPWNTLFFSIIIYEDASTV